MTSAPSVSVVVPVLNGAQTIGDMLSGLQSQVRVPQSTETIVVDNGSSDSTRDIVRTFDVTLLEEPKRGPSAARNCGLKTAKGEIVVHLDADTLPARQWLAELVKPFTEPATIMVAGRTVPFPPKTAPERYIAQSQLYDTKQDVARDPCPFAASLNMAVRRDAALEVGGWSEDMMTSEDIDFCIRLRKRFSMAITYQPSAVLFHRNRNSDEGLKRMAWTYGEGGADVYLRYPDELPWGLAQRLHLTRKLATRSVMPHILSAARLMGFCAPEAVEHARYHRMWSWWYWWGFYSFYRHRERRWR